jgi:hypothetical protein
LQARHPEVGLGLLVGADLDPVDELTQELLHGLGPAVSDGVPKLVGDAVQFSGARKRRGRSLHEADARTVFDVEPFVAGRLPATRLSWSTSLLRRSTLPVAAVLAGFIESSHRPDHNRA